MSQFAEHSARRDRESSQRHAAVDRTPEIRDITTFLAERLAVLQTRKADTMTDRDLDLTIDAMMLALQHINTLHERARTIHRFMGGK